MLLDQLSHTILAIASTDKNLATGYHVYKDKSGLQLLQ
jgi:hypothetical protein